MRFPGWQNLPLAALGKFAEFSGCDRPIIDDEAVSAMVVFVRCC